MLDQTLIINSFSKKPSAMKRRPAKQFSKLKKSIRTKTPILSPRGKLSTLISSARENLDPNLDISIKKATYHLRDQRDNSILRRHVSPFIESRTSSLPQSDRSHASNSSISKKDMKNVASSVKSMPKKYCFARDLSNYFINGICKNPKKKLPIAKSVQEEPKKSQNKIFDTLQKYIPKDLPYDLSFITFQDLPTQAKEESVPKQAKSARLVVKINQPKMEEI